MEHVNFITEPQYQLVVKTHDGKTCFVQPDWLLVMSGQNLSLAGQMICLMTKIIICRLVVTYGNDWTFYLFGSPKSGHNKNIILLRSNNPVHWFPT